MEAKETSSIHPFLRWQVTATELRPEMEPNWESEDSYRFNGYRATGTVVRVTSLKGFGSTKEKAEEMAKGVV